MSDGEEVKPFEGQTEEHLAPDSVPQIIEDEDDMRKRMMGVAQGSDQSKQFGNSTLNSLTTAVLARAFLPSP